VSSALDPSLSHLTSTRHRRTYQIPRVIRLPHVIGQLIRFHRSDFRTPQGNLSDSTGHQFPHVIGQLIRFHSPSDFHTPQDNLSNSTGHQASTRHRATCQIPHAIRLPHATRQLIRFHRPSDFQTPQNNLSKYRDDRVSCKPQQKK
jgi:hypothetical protein